MKVNRQIKTEENIPQDSAEDNQLEKKNDEADSNKTYLY